MHPYRTAVHNMSITFVTYLFSLFILSFPLTLDNSQPLQYLIYTTMFCYIFIFSKCFHYWVPITICQGYFCPFQISLPYVWYVLKYFYSQFTYSMLNQDSCEKIGMSIKCCGMLYKAWDQAVTIYTILSKARDVIENHRYYCPITIQSCPRLGTW